MIKALTESKTMRPYDTQDTRYMTAEELAEYINPIIAHGYGNDKSNFDIIDPDTGEVYLEIGQPYSKARLPQKTGSARLVDPAGYTDWEAEDQRDRETSRAEFEAAVAEFTSGLSMEDMGDPEYQPADVAYDMADNFFYSYPDWMSWSWDIGMSKRDMKEYIADMVHDALVPSTWKNESHLHEADTSVLPTPTKSTSGSTTDADEWFETGEGKALKSLPDDDSESGKEKFTAIVDKLFGDSDVAPEVMEKLATQFPKIMAAFDYPTNAITKESRKMKRTRRMNEAADTPNFPTTFDAYRRTFANALKRAGAPEDLVEEVGDVGYEGAGVAEVLYNEWAAIQSELRVDKPKSAHITPDENTAEKEARREGFASYFRDSIYDTVLMIVDEFENPMNYAPGTRAPKLDGVELAERVIENWGARTISAKTADSRRNDLRKKSEQHPAQRLANEVAEEIRAEGASNVEVKRSPGEDEEYTITFNTDEDLENIGGYLVSTFVRHSPVGGYEFEEIRNSETWGISGDALSGDSQLLVILDDLLFEQTPTIIVAYFGL